MRRSRHSRRLRRRCAAEGDLCASPTEVQGFKTCADVAKAEAEGELVVYATNPEAAELRVLAEFNKLFPKIKTNYTRLQAGALYAKVSAERQAKTYTVDVMQISDMGMVLDFQKKNGYVHYVSPQMARLQARIQKPARGAVDLGRDRPGRHRLQPEHRAARPGAENLGRGDRPEMDRRDHRQALHLRACSTSPGTSCAASTAPITGRNSAS